MIKLTITTDGEEICDSFIHRNTTLIENALVLRRLKELELKLLQMNYDSKLEVSEDEEDE